jgi:hypothetical protein
MEVLQLVGTIIGSLSRIEMMMKWIIAAVVCYGGTVALLYVAQRSLQYFPVSLNGMTFST